VPEETSNPNPIVALATKIRARRDIESIIDASPTPEKLPDASDVLAGLQAFGEALGVGCKRLNAILGKNGVTFVRLERPLRLRLRFRDKRVSLDADQARQLVVVKGLELDGDYQFDTSAQAPALINLSKLSTEAGYGQAVTASSLLKLIAQEAELPPPRRD
jgi:hypothetical protein